MGNIHIEALKHISSPTILVRKREGTELNTGAARQSCLRDIYAMFYTGVPNGISLQMQNVTDRFLGDVQIIEEPVDNGVIVQANATIYRKFLREASNV